MRIDLNEHLSHKRIIIYNGIEIGVYAYHITDDDTYFINEINILKEYQCKGIGTKILKDVLEKNKNDNIRTILQVFKDNPAINLYKRLGFVIYDETETHYRSEKHIQVEIEKMKHENNTTIIAIAHRLTTLKNCDRIIVLNKGKIEEDGKFDDLLAKNGMFNDMYYGKLS